MPGQRSISQPNLEKQREAARENELMWQAFSAADVSGRGLDTDSLGRALDALGYLGSMQQDDLEERMAGCINGRCDWDDFRRIASALRRAILLERESDSLKRLTLNKKVHHPHVEPSRRILLSSPRHLLDTLTLHLILSPCCPPPSAASEPLPPLREACSRCSPRVGWPACQDVRPSRAASSERSSRVLSINPPPPPWGFPSCSTHD